MTLRMAAWTVALSGRRGVFRGRHDGRNLAAAPRQRWQRSHVGEGVGGDAIIRGVSKASTDVPEGFLTLDEAGPLIGLSPNRLREYAVAGRLHAVKWRGVWWTTIQHLEEFDTVPRRPGRRRVSRRELG